MKRQEVYELGIYYGYHNPTEIAEEQWRIDDFDAYIEGLCWKCFQKPVSEPVKKVFVEGVTDVQNNPDLYEQYDFSLLTQFEDNL